MLHRYRALFLALSAAILLLLAYTAWWAALAGRVRTVLTEAPGKALAENGIVLDLRDPVVAGFPLSLTVDLSGLRAQWPSGTILELGPLAAHAFAWNPSEIHVTAAAPLRLDLAGSARHATISGTASGLTGTVNLGLDGQPLLVTASLSALGALANARWEAAMATITWTAPAQPPGGPTDPQGQVSLLVRDLDLPGRVPAPLSRRIEQVSLSYEPRGPLPAKPSVEGMTAWRDGGGTVEILGARVLWSGMDLRAKATLALDRQMQPEGAGAAELSGGQTLIDMLAQNGGMQTEQAAAMKAALSTLSKRTDDGRDVLQVPVTLQNSRLFVGPLQVATLPPIPWN
ncbi:hypothetical protein CHU95_09150 [Niveispirillum lacus]|uniref:DUF2125 domain-containing protein n=1 Tax=Niveispirillum lacus TaxID=1981099 RepID=A0A255Z1I6_9PROT|nr:DUF2125 domain-containing protein [Niveispirillum lacus]OYQ35363.1 hypothetical protein CHU95_09150 [Niveispirillum lacus]